MGLHERGPIGENPTSDDLERQNVLWVLYAVDKQRIFIRGPPCRIYLFECHLELPQPNGIREETVIANLRWACIIEAVYRHLYAPRASRPTSRNHQQRVRRLGNRLQNWAHRFEEVLRSAECGSTAEMMIGLQLRYAFHVTFLLIHHTAEDKDGKVRCLNQARKALEIIQKMSSSTFISEGYMNVLER